MTQGSRRTMAGRCWKNMKIMLPASRSHVAPGAKVGTRGMVVLAPVVVFIAPCVDCRPAWFLVTCSQPCQLCTVLSVRGLDRRVSKEIMKSANVTPSVSADDRWGVDILSFFAVSSFRVPRRFRRVEPRACRLCNNRLWRWIQVIRHLMKMLLT